MKVELIAKNWSRKSVFYMLLACMMAFVLLTVLQDFIRSGFQDSAFYISESFLFSTFWWIFVPLLYVQFRLGRQKLSIAYQILLVLTPVVLHLIAFPLLVWTISALFFYHTFAVRQTLFFILSEHLYQILLFYIVPFSVYRFFRSKFHQVEDTSESAREEKDFPTSLLLTQGAKHIKIELPAVTYFSASPPYVIVHADGKEYLHNASLKSVSEFVDPEQFIRIHKSSIVNIKMVVCYTSRLNGDYDLTMRDGSQLRVSRNYAPLFKQKFQDSHRLAAK